MNNKRNEKYHKKKIESMWLSPEYIRLRRTKCARRYLDPVTGNIYIAHMPDEIRKGGLFGDDINAAVAFMKGGCNMSYTTIGQLHNRYHKQTCSCKTASGLRSTRLVQRDGPRFEHKG